MVAVDFSDNAVEAFENVLSLARPDEDELVIFTVTEHEIVWLGVLECNSTLVDKARKVEHKGAKNNLMNFGLRCAQQSVKYTLVLTQGGNVGETICRACKDLKVNCLVIGRRGISHTKRLLYGSTSRYCVDNAPCSVLVVKSLNANTKFHHQQTCSALYTEEKAAHETNNMVIYAVSGNPLP